VAQKNTCLPETEDIIAIVPIVTKVSVASGWPLKATVEVLELRRTEGPIGP
jgi:hypothetical protein